MIVSIGGEKHWPWRAVDQHGAVLDVLVQRRRDAAAAKRLMRKLLKRHGLPRVMATYKLRSYAVANTALGLSVEHRQHKGLNNRAENSHQPTRAREKVMRRFKSARQLHPSLNQTVVDVVDLLGQRWPRKIGQPAKWNGRGLSQR